jgi:hypothetical protein
VVQELKEENALLSLKMLSTTISPQNAWFWTYFSWETWNVSTSSMLPPMSSNEMWVHYFTLKKSKTAVCGKVLLIAFLDT